MTVPTCACVPGKPICNPITKKLYLATFKQIEVPLYGSDRLGDYKPKGILATVKFTLDTAVKAGVPNVYKAPISRERTLNRILTYKHYEMKDHLGNVRVLVSDARQPIFNGASALIDVKAKVEAYYNYFAFGMLMPGRVLNPVDSRYGFQKQEKDDEIAGTGNHYTFKYREYDPRTGRFWSVDPLAYRFPWNSSYAFSENRIIDGRELEGLEVVLINEKKDPAIYKGGIANTDKSAVHIYAHGTPSNIDVTGDGNWSAKKEDFQTILGKSDVYQTNKNSEDLVVIIHSCRAGRSYVDENGNYVPSYAEKKSAEFPNLTIIAPDERDAFSSEGEELGPRKIDDPMNNRGDYKKGAEHKTNKESGRWNVFKNGKNIGSYSADDYDAEEAPSWAERNFQLKENENQSENGSSETSSNTTSKEIK